MLKGGSVLFKGFCLLVILFNCLNGNAITVTANNGTISCKGGTGDIAVTVSGGTGPYTYDLYNGVPTFMGGTGTQVKSQGGISTSSYTFSGYVAGSYYVLVYDSKNASAGDNALLTEPATGLSASVTTTATSCSNSTDGKINVTTVSGGWPGYTYNVDGGTFQSSSSFSGLTAGSHSVIVKDSQGCTVTVPATISAPAPVVPSVKITSVKCNGNSDGKIDVTGVSGGTSPYQYKLDKPGVPGTYGSVTSFPGLKAGNYVLTVKSANGCFSDPMTITVAEPAVLDFTVSVVKNITCFGSSDGIIKVVPQGGTPSYSYLWTGGITVDNVTGVAYGDYYNCTVTDANGCSYNASVIYDESLPGAVIPSQIVINPDPAAHTDACQGQNNGTISVVASGGTAPLTYSLGAGGTGTYQASGSFTNQAPGTYPVWVKDSHSCKVQGKDVTIAQLSLPVPTISGPLAACVASTNNKYVTESGNSGYQWTVVGGTITSGAGTNTINVTWNTVGTQSVSVNYTNSQGCSAVSPVKVNVTVNAATSVTTQPVSQTLCAGAPANFSVVAAGTGPFTYQWKKNGTDIAGATSSNYSIPSVSSGDVGSYTVAVTGTCGTVTSSAATLTVNAATSISTQPVSQSICLNGSVTFSVVAAGTGPFTYQWKKNGTDIPGATSSSYTKSSLTAGDAGSYTVVVTGSCGNITSNVATLTINAVTGITTQPVTQTVCSGTSVSFTVVASGTAPFTYQWKKNGTDIPTATSSTYTISAVASSDAGSYTVVVTGACGNITSNAATLTVNAATSITTQPLSQSVCTGVSATFSVVAAGTAPFTYQWKKNGTDIPTATSSTYTIPAVISSDAGSYTVVVTGACGNVTSSSATLMVNTPPSITSQPVSQTACPGGSATFNVAATGTGLTYKWQKGGVDIPGATNSTYTISPVAASDAGSYTVVVSGTCAPSVTSNAVTLTVNAATSITTQPVSQTLCSGASATFSVVAGGTAPFTYQWKKNGTDISGATSSSYTIPTVSSSDAGSYTVAVTGTCGNATSSVATLTVNAATSISTQPLSQAICLGSPVSFSVTAGGTGPFTYQWQKGGSNIIGATSSTYTIPAVNNADAGSYSVVVTGACGNATSSAAILTVNAITGITAQPLSQTVCFGSPVTFSVTAYGTAPFTYQWKKGGSDIPGAASSTYTIPAVSGSDAGNYTVVITGVCGNVTSNIATLTVNPATSITTQPASQTLCSGGSATFSVVAGGTAPFTYQWKKDGTDISGATSSSYTIPSVSSSDAGDYTVSVSGLCGSVNSTSAKLVVNQPVSITTQPLPQTVCQGASANFSVVAGGTGPYTYQWRKNGVAISGATSASYNIGTTALTDNGNYDVVVSGICGTPVTSTAVALKVNALPVPSITGPTEVCNGASGNIYQTDAGMSNYVWTISSGGTKNSGGGNVDDNIGVTWSGSSSQTVTVTYTDVNGCIPLQPTQLSVNITQPPLVNAGPNDTVCYESPYTVPNASVQNYSTFRWVSLGDGKFENGSTTISDVLKPTYTSGDNDKLKGFVDLVLEATGNGACGLYRDTLRLIIPAKLQAAIGAPKPFDITASTRIQVSLKTYKHRNIQDLGYYLIAPDGTTMVTLKAAPLKQNINYNRGYDANLTFDSQHSPATDTLIIGGVAKPLGQYSLQGTYAATGDWSVLYNKFNPSDGGWTVAVRDNDNLLGYSQGSIVDANITFTSSDGKVVSFISGAVDIPIKNPTTTPYVVTSYIVPLGLRTKCANSCDATAVVNVIGGIAPYTYKWSDVKLLAKDSVQLCKGTYSVQVTDAVGCVTTASVNVTAPEPIVVDSIKYSNGNPLKCHGDTTSIRFYAKGGTGALKVSLGSVIKNVGEYFPQLKAGVDTFHIFDVNGCTQDAIITISEPEAIAITSYSKKDISCYHATNGEIHVTAKGGNLIKYQLFNNSSKTVTVENKLSPDFLGLTKGFYRVIASDSIYGCKADTSVVIEIKEPDTLVVKTISTNISCFNSIDGKISLVVTGGTSPYYYNYNGIWNKGTLITNLDAGIYTIQVRDSLGCVAVPAKDTITKPEQIILDRSKWSKVDALDCRTNPGKIIAAGSYLSPSLVSGSLLYSTDLKNWQASDTLIVYGGLRTVYVRDGLGSIGCYAKDTITVGGPHITIIDRKVTNPLCYGGSDGSIILKAVGNGPITYTMNGSAAKDTMLNLPAGVYNYTLKDTMSCIALFDTTLVNPVPITFEISDKVYNSATRTGSLSVVVHNTNGTYQVALAKINESGSQIFTEDTNTPKYVYSNLPFGVYKLLASDNTCHRDTMFFFGEIDTLKVTSVTLKDASCYGTSGKFIYNAPTATPPVTVWAYNKDNFSSFYKANLKIQDTVSLPVGRYHIVVFDNIGRNWISDTIVIKEPSPVYFRGITVDPKCLNAVQDDDAIGYIYQNPIGLDKAQSINYEWNKKSSYIQFNKETGKRDTVKIDIPLTLVRDTVKNSVGLYTLKITNGVCEYDTIYKLKPRINLSVTTLDSIIGCIGDSVHLRCTASSNSGDNTFIYSWTPTNYLTKDSTASPSVKITYESVGPYSVKVTNAGCYEFGYQVLAAHKVYDLQIGYYNLPSTIQEYPDTVKTRQGTELIFDTYPPVPFVHYSWIPSGDTVSAITYRPEHSDHLILTVVTSDGCVETDSVYIKFPDKVIPPTGFTPNGDGINDVWEIDHIEDYPNVLVEVYNRWGSLVFKSKGYDNVTPGKVFDGTRNGRPLPIGTYYFIIKLNDGYESQNGTVTIMR
ncbi:MAG: immunoglobulin domain-containing protein [Bacteroidota bacterium]|nr:immunoglobulin domain-containing protein [Bacteroidota bacterium]